jgi:hypothetical protein
VSGSSSAGRWTAQKQSDRPIRRMPSRMTNFVHPEAEGVKLVTHKLRRMFLHR